MKFNVAITCSLLCAVFASGEQAHSLEADSRRQFFCTYVHTIIPDKHSLGKQSAMIQMIEKNQPIGAVEYVVMKDWPVDPLLINLGSEITLDRLGSSFDPIKSNLISEKKVDDWTRTVFFGQNFGTSESIFILLEQGEQGLSQRLSIQLHEIEMRHSDNTMVYFYNCQPN